MRIVIKYIYIISVTKCHKLKHKYKITQQYYITYSKICQIDYIHCKSLENWLKRL